MKTSRQIKRDIKSDIDNIINDRVLSFSEKIDKISGIERVKVEHLTVGDV